MELIQIFTHIFMQWKCHFKILNVSFTKLCAPNQTIILKCTNEIHLKSDEKTNDVKKIFHTPIEEQVLNEENMTKLQID